MVKVPTRPAQIPIRAVSQVRPRFDNKLRVVTCKRSQLAPQCLMPSCLNRHHLPPFLITPVTASVVSGGSGGARVVVAASAGVAESS